MSFVGGKQKDKHTGLDRERGKEGCMLTVVAVIPVSERVRQED